MCVVCDLLRVVVWFVGVLVIVLCVCAFVCGCLCLCAPLIQSVFVCCVCGLL